MGTNRGVLVEALYCDTVLIQGCIRALAAMAIYPRISLISFHIISKQRNILISHMRFASLSISDV